MPRGYKTDYTRYIGVPIGCLTFTGEYDGPGSARPIFLCGRCGRDCVAAWSNVLRGSTTRCKDCFIENLRERKTSHGMAGSREYRIWIHMKTRCLNSFDKAFPDYGGRGIEVCDKWLAFQGFFEDMGRCPSKLHTLERVDNDGNYCRENCVWATMAEQSRNKRSSRKTLFRGEVSCGRDIAIVLSVHNRFVYQCLDLGMNGDDIEELVNRFRSLS